MTDRCSRVHVWVPDLFSATGGIQTFSRHFLEALGEEVPTQEIRVFLKNDLPGNVHRHKGFGRVAVYGHWPFFLRRPGFAAECLRRAWCERPQLIVSTHLNFGPLAQMVRKLTGVPYVLVAHGIDAWRLNNGARKRALQKADLVLAVSRYTRDWLIRKIGLDAGKVQILPNTFSPQRFALGPKSPRLLERYGLNAQAPVILTVCRLAGAERYKGYDQMIRALPEILRAVPNARYLLAGTGPDRPRIEKLIADLGVRNAVVFAGFIPDEELSEHYNLSDVFAMPSKAEGFGIVYLEALACGKPVLAGDQDGSRDALADGELGLLVNPDDTAQIAAETIRVLRRQHAHPHLFHPELLRRRVTELFGFESFKREVAARLKPFLREDRRQPTADRRQMTVD
jgi:glycosyltransferase involved in cell wall biosynthesis